MCLFVGLILVLAVCILAWTAICLQSELQAKIMDNQALYKQLRECKDDRLKDSIAEKAAAWRRDRRSGDNPRGGIVQYDE